MSRQLAVFKKPSDIIFKAARTEPDEVFTIRDAQRGNTFLHRGAVCMMTEVSAFQALIGSALLPSNMSKDRVRDFLKESTFITNLQTGRTFAVKLDDKIEWIKVTMTVESE